MDSNSTTEWYLCCTNCGGHYDKRSHEPVCAFCTSRSVKPATARDVGGRDVG